MKLILSSQEGSLAFKDRVLVLDSRPGQISQIGVHRSSPQQKPADNNAVFDCKVRLTSFTKKGFQIAHYAKIKQRKRSAVKLMMMTMTHRLWIN